MSTPFMQRPEIHSSEIVYEGFFNVRVDLLELPHGLRRPYTLLTTGCDAAVVLAETEEGKLVVNQEYRHPAGHCLLSCPGGRLDYGESPLEGGRRELLEETGYSSEDIRLLGSVYPFPAMCDQKIYFLFAKGARLLQSTQHESFELIQTFTLAEEELLQRIASGAPTDGVLCTALLLKRLQIVS
jgi:ADP-ribose pyrophosphatase